jgi:uncharacterized membrane protein YkgB
VTVPDSVRPKIQTAGAAILRYGLVVVVGWIGLLKFTGSEAMRIQLYVSHSPFLQWTDALVSPRTLAAVFGCVEVAAALLMASRQWLPRCSALGSLISIGLFLTTLSFFVTTPGIGDPAAGGFPALSPTGQFLLKDLVLLGASVWTLGESLTGQRIQASTEAAALRRV